MAFFGLFGKEKKENLDQGLEKTRSSIFSKLNRLIFSKSKIDDDVLDELEESGNWSFSEPEINENIISFKIF